MLLETTDTDDSPIHSVASGSSHSSSCQSSPKLSKKRKISKADEIDELLIKSLSSLQDKAAAEQVPQQDEEGLFGQMVSATIRCLNPRQRAMAKLKIHQFLIETEFPSEFATPPIMTNYPTNNYYNSNSDY